MHEVLLNIKAEQELGELNVRNPAVAAQVEAVLDALEERAELFEDEPWPHDQGAAYLTHVGETGWLIAWVYNRDRNAVLVGKIFQLPTV